MSPRSALFALVVYALAAGCGGGAQESADAAAAAPTAVAAAPILREHVVVHQIWPGELVADTADLAPRVSGRLEEVSVRIGDAVERGQVLARLDDDELRQQLAEARAQLAVAEASLVRARTGAELAELELGRIEPLAAKELVSAQDLDAKRAGLEGLRAEVTVADARIAEARARVARLQEQVSDMQLVAPFDGLVAERFLDRGATVQAGTPVLRIVEAGPLRVRFRVPEHDLGGLEPGLTLSVTAGGLTDGVPGRVERVAGAVSTADRSLAVEGVLEPDPRLRAGMFAQVRLERQVIPDALVVPGAAVLERPGAAAVERGVFTVDGAVARWVSVEVRGRSGDRVAVAGALEPGQQVLVLGHEGLRDGGTILVDGATP